MKTPGMTTILGFILIPMFFIFTQTVFAWVPGDRIVPCDGLEDCDFNKLVELAQNIVSFIFFFSIPIATLLFAYVGFLFITGGDNESKRKRAKSILLDVIIGVIIIGIAWLVVYVITDNLLSDDYKTNSLLQP